MNLVTGATGFLGGAVTRRLVAAGASVRVLAQPGSDRRLLDGLRVEVAEGSLGDRASLDRALRGCRRLFHVAALYRLWLPDRRQFYEVNVEGTRRVLEAAGAAGVDQVVYTSSVGALGIPGDGSPGTEETPVSLEDMVGDYKRSKFLAEGVAREFARQGLKVVIVNPSAPVGTGDIKPTPTGQIIVDFLRGRMCAYVDTGLNLVDVEDVAAGHLLAAERGKSGQRYILGGANFTLRQIFTLLGQIAGIRPPRLRLRTDLVLPVAWVAEWVADHLTGRPPVISLDAVRMARKRMFFDPAKAVGELGMPQSAIEGALERAVCWFRRHGYVPAA